MKGQNPALQNTSDTFVEIIFKIPRLLHDEIKLKKKLYKNKKTF